MYKIDSNYIIKNSARNVAASIAKEIQLTLLRKTDLYFKIEGPQITTGLGVSYGHVNLSNPSSNMFGDNMGKVVKVGRFSFTADANIIQVSAMFNLNGSSSVDILADASLLPKETLLFGLLRKSTNGTVESSIKQVLSSHILRNYGIRNTSFDWAIPNPAVLRCGIKEGG